MQCKKYRVDMMHLWFLAAYCTQSHRGILSCGLLVLRDCIYTCNLGLLPSYFPNTLVSVDVCWYRSMKQVMRDNLYFGHFASFMIMLFDCTGKILDVSLWLPRLMCIFILLIYVHISCVLQIAWSDETPRWLLSYRISEFLKHQRISDVHD